jgi:hypothetical protein
MIKSCRMQLVRDHPKVIGKSFCPMTEVEYRVDQTRGFRRHLTSQESKFDRKHGQLLIQTVMQFSSDTTPLLFLGLEEFAGEILKGLSCPGTFQCHAGNGAFHRVSLLGLPAPSAGTLNPRPIHLFSHSAFQW